MLLDKDCYIAECRKLNGEPKSDKKALEFARLFLLCPVDCNYLSAEKIAIVTLHLRRAERLLRDRMALQDRPKNPLGFVKNNKVKCYFCGVCGSVGAFPFTSVMSAIWQTPACDMCLKGKL